MALQPATAPVASWPPESAEMLVHELLGRGWLVLAHGPQGSGKTFISVSLAWHLSLGLRWRGRNDRPRHGGLLLPARRGRQHQAPVRRAGAQQRGRSIADAADVDRAGPSRREHLGRDRRRRSPTSPWLSSTTASSLSDVSLDLIAVCERIRAQSGAAVLAHSENAILPPELSRGWDGDWRFERTVNDLMLMTVERLRDSATIGRLGFRLEGDGDSAVAVGTDARPVMRPQMTSALTSIFDAIQGLAVGYNDYSVSRAEFDAAVRGLDLEVLRSKPPKQVSQQIARWQDWLVGKGLLRRSGELLTVNPSWRHVRRLRDLDRDALAEELAEDFHV